MHLRVCVQHQQGKPCNMNIALWQINLIGIMAANLKVMFIIKLSVFLGLYLYLITFFIACEKKKIDEKNLPSHLKKEEKKFCKKTKFL